MDVGHFGKTGKSGRPAVLPESSPGDPLLRSCGRIIRDVLHSERHHPLHPGAEAGSRDLAGGCLAAGWRPELS